MRWRWSSIGPPAAVAVLAAASVWPLQPALLGLCVAALIVAVFTAVHHAEVVAHKLGEPFGTLVLALALAVTVIEVALIVSLMLVGGPDAAVLPRDTLFATVMIICNGVIGICVLVGALRHHEQCFRAEGATAALAALIAMSTLSLVLPVFTSSSPGATYTRSQLAFAACASLGLWLMFVFMQTVRHRDYFLPPSDAADHDTHAEMRDEPQAVAKALGTTESP